MQRRTVYTASDAESACTLAMNCSPTCIGRSETMPMPWAEQSKRPAARKPSPQGARVLRTETCRSQGIRSPPRRSSQAMEPPLRSAAVSSPPFARLVRCAMS